MKKKKSLIAIVALFLVIFVGATFAYFQSNSTFVNIFNTGTYRIVTTEVFESPSNWVPGQEIPKTITSTNEGTIPAAVRVSYTEQWLDSNNQDITNSITSGTAIINLDNTSSWIQEGNYYYYKYILNPQDTTRSFIKSVTLNPQIGSGNGEMQCTTSQDGLTQECVATNSALGAKYVLTITKETIQADKYESIWNTNVSITEKPLVEIMTANRTKDTLQVGDEICVNGATTECFNFIRYDGNNDENVVLLSKYNLKVGNIYSSDGNTKTGEYSSSDTGYGLQSSEARGQVSGQTRYGTVAFSGTNYWDDNGSPKSNYPGAYLPGPNYPTVYDSINYKGTPGNNDYSVAYYVENYKDILETYGLTVQSARLLTYSEATDSSIGCDVNDLRPCPVDEFITYTSFWLGSALDSSGVWLVFSNGSFNDNGYSNGKYGGVRPVIVVAKSDI